MRFTTLIAAAAVSALAGSAFAQETSAVPRGEEQHHAISPQEEEFFVEFEPVLGGFYVDETFAELRTAEEIETAWMAVPADEQARLREACERVEENRGDYGDVTIGLCAQLGEFQN